MIKNSLPKKLGLKVNGRCYCLSRNHRFRQKSQQLRSSCSRAVKGTPNFQLPLKHPKDLQPPTPNSSPNSKNKDTLKNSKATNTCNNASSIWNNLQNKRNFWNKLRHNCNSKRSFWGTMRSRSIYNISNSSIMTIFNSSISRFQRETLWMNLLRRNLIIRIHLQCIRMSRRISWQKG